MHPPVKPVSFLPRILALWLSFGIALPASPAWALRPREAAETPSTKAGLEERLQEKPRLAAGLEEPTDEDVDRVLSALQRGTAAERIPAYRVLRQWIEQQLGAVSLKKQAPALVLTLTRNLAQPPGGGDYDTAERTLAAFAKAGVAVDALGSAVPQIVGHFSSSDYRVTWAAGNTLATFAKERVGEEELEAAVPRIVDHLDHWKNSQGFAHSASKETLVAMAEAGFAVGALEAAVPQIVDLLVHPEFQVQREAKETLEAFAKSGVAAEALAAAVPKIFGYLYHHVDPYVGRAVHEVLTVFARRRVAVEELGTAARQSGGYRFGPEEAVRERVKKLLEVLAQERVVVEAVEPLDGMGRLEKVMEDMSSLPGYLELSLGGRALLRRKLEKTTSLSEEEIRRHGERWLAHWVRLEGLDRAARLASAGAELHLPVEADHLKLQWLARRMASGTGAHSMVPWISEAEGRQIDIRLLPAYPAVFRRLLGEMLGDMSLLQVQ